MELKFINSKKSIIFISPYPEKGSYYTKKAGAVGGFNRNIIESLRKHFRENKYIIFSTNRKGGKIKVEKYYEDLYVLSGFSKFTILFLWQILRNIFVFNKVNRIVIQFEFYLFGGIFNVLLFLFFFFVCWVSKKKVYLFLHQSVVSIEEIAEHIGLKRNSFFLKIVSLGYKVYLVLVGFLVYRVIVTEEVFRKRLSRIMPSYKIIFIPHGVDGRLVEINKSKAKESLCFPKDKFIVLFFGYLSWYKGADLLLEWADKMKENEKYLFVFAGGEHPFLKDKVYYQKYIASFKRKYKNVIITGFVPEEKIPFYFSIADIVVFPYRIMMSSSGPLSLAFSFKKPVLLSERLKDYLESEDFRQAVYEAGLSTDKLFFRLSFKDFFDKLINIDLRKLRKFSLLMRQKRDYLYIANRIGFSLELENSNISLLPNYIRDWRRRLVFTSYKK